MSMSELAILYEDRLVQPSVRISSALTTEILPPKKSIGTQSLETGSSRQEMRRHFRRSRLEVKNPRPTLPRMWSPVVQFRLAARRKAEPLKVSGDMFATFDERNDLGDLPSIW